MHYQTGMLVLVFVVLALLIGATVRHLLKGTQIPYTVALLIIGLGLGLVQRTDFFPTYSPMAADTLNLVATIDPHLILYVFLPTLIFESAFAMEVHLFKRIFLQIAILAVPGLILATALTAGLVKWTFPWDWSWALCLMFGALISATDPVAVVALLKEVSSRKRLETLIEGESLLNDGTAIVFFTLFLGWVVASYENPGAVDGAVSLFAVAGEFISVVSLGLIIGVVLGGLSIYWIGRVFNDPMIEITLSIVVAYLVFMLAESIHVSGVVAVVALALLFASYGRTRVSPEVSGFLHHFWEMMAHIANTLIFLLVGVLITSRVPLDDVSAWQALGILYLGIMMIRAFSVTLFMPILKRIGIGITREKATVLVWGGLRGAVSLALVLTVAQHESIPREIGDIMLFLTAGIVVMTILFNGASMGLLLKFLHLDKLPAGKQATVDKAEAQINQAIYQILPGMMDDEFLKGANWEEVKKITSFAGASEPIGHESISDDELCVAFRRRLLETERKDYWSQFEQGTLGQQATNKLVEAVEHALDGDPCISPRNDLNRLWETPLYLKKVKNIYGLRALALAFSFNRLALGYDVARGFIQAQNALKSHVKDLAPSEHEASLVLADVEKNTTQTLHYIQQLRQTFPEIVHALQTHAASRLLLNRERAVINEQLKKAVLDSPEASRMIADVEARMQKLQKMPELSSSNDSQQVLAAASWLKGLSEDTRDQLEGIMQHSIYHDHEVIAAQGKPLCALGIVARGSVNVVEEKSGKKIKRVLGPGQMLAAMSLLSGSSPGSFIADTLVDIVWLNGEKLKPLMAKDPDLAEALGHIIA